MKQIAYLGLKTLLVSGLVAGLAVVGKKEMDYRKGKADYDSAKELAGLLWQDGRGASGPEVQTPEPSWLQHRNRRSWRPWLSCCRCLLHMRLHESTCQRCPHQHRRKA